MYIFVQMCCAGDVLPVGGATRPPGWAHPLQGQTLGSHSAEESGRYSLKSIFFLKKKKRKEKTKEDRESRHNETKKDLDQMKMNEDGERSRQPESRADAGTGVRWER